MRKYLKFLVFVSKHSMSSLVLQTHEVYICLCVRLHVGTVCGCRDGPLTANTSKQSCLLYACRMESLKPHSLFCQWLVSVFCSFQCSHNPSFKKTFPGRWNQRPLRGQQLPPLQIFWHMWSLDLEEEVASFHTLQERPFAQSQRWKISKPWEPFFLCLVHTSPCLSTGLQIFVQKWRAQQ